MPIKFIRRIFLKDTTVGRILQGVGVAVGIGGVSATSVGLFELTGDTIVDVTIIICTTAIIILGGKLPVPKEEQHKINE